MTEAPSPPPLAAVTGAAGFLGRAAVARLLADGWRVRQLVRTLPDRLPPNTEAVVGTLDDEDSLQRLVRGAEAVVHSAGLNRARRDAEYYEVNVEGSWRLGRAVRAAAPQARLVVVSSLAARFPWLSPYAASKADGEDAAVDGAGTRSWVVLRPGPLFGPGDRKTLALLEMATWPLMPIPDRPRARISLVHVADAAAAVAAACAPGRRAVVWEVGGEALTWAKIARAVTRATATTPILARIPPRLLQFGAALTHPLGSGDLPLLSPGRLAELLHDDWAARPERLPPARLWRPRVGLDQGLHEAAAWFRANGWLPPPKGLAVTGQRG